MIAARQEYLERFGYVSHQDDKSGRTVREAVRRFQAFAGIPVSGVVDRETRRLLQRPRCGVADVKSSATARDKRYALQGGKWSRTNLTWR